MKKALIAVMAAGMALWAAGAMAADDAGRAEERAREALRAALDAAQEGLAESPIEAGTPVALLPVKGDKDGRAARRLRVALYGAGKTLVEGPTDTDPMLRKVMETIDWEELKTGILAPETINRIGQIQGAKVLLWGRVETTGTEKRPVVELELFATEVPTAKQLWARVFSSEAPLPSGPEASVIPEHVPLNAGVVAEEVPGAEREAALLDTYVRGVLADLRYRIDSGEEDDVTLALAPAATVYAHTGDSWIYEGEVRAEVAVKGGEARVLGSTTLFGRGERGWSPREAHTSLAHALEEQLGTWLKRTLNPEAIGFSGERLSFRLAGPIETAQERAGVAALQKGLAGLDGVRSARVESQDDRAGTVTFKVVYENAKLGEGIANALFAANPELADLLW